MSWEGRLKGLAKLIVSLYLFLLSINLISAGFKLLGKGFAESLIENTSNPLTALFIGLLSTSIVQSSSATTSMIVGMVAANPAFLPNAIPMVMGANMGTSVTNTMVSFGHVVRKKEFKRALAASTIDDFFNMLSAVFFLPLELLGREIFKPWLGGKGPIEAFATFMAHSLEGVGVLTVASPVKIVISPVSNTIKHFLTSTVPDFAGVAVLVLAFIILVFSLKSIVGLARKLGEKAGENFISTHLFKSPRRAFGLGLLLTSTMQSSSITLSLIVPLVGAGLLSVEQVFPYALGSDVGTTITAIIAALGVASAVENVEFARAALTIALFHFTYNGIGALVFYYLRALPIGLSKKLAEFTSKQPARAVAYVMFFFYVIPILYIVITRMLGV